MGMQTYSTNLFENRSTTGNGTWQNWPGGKGFICAVGTFGGTSVTLQMRGPDPSGTAVDVKLLDSTGTFVTVNISAAGGYVFELPDCQIRAVSTGGTPSGLYVQARRTLG